jgi:chromosome segregation ATPase
MKRMTKAISAAALAGACFLGGAALAQSSNLQRALDHLQAARNDLEQNSRKDQHSKQALTSVEQAIEHVRKGLDESRKKDQKGYRQEEQKEEKSLQQEQKDLEKSQQKSVAPEPKKTKK